MTMRTDRHVTAPVFLLLSIVLLATTGCGGLKFLASPNYEQMAADFPFRAERPIARELRYTYTGMTFLGGKFQEPLVTADPVTRSEGLPEQHIAAVNNLRDIPNTQQSDRTSELGRQASEDGDHEMAAHYHALAASQAATEAAMGRAVASVDLMFTTMNMLAALGQAFFDSEGAAIAGWLYRSGVIGEEAPEGSVLYLDMRYVVKGRKFRLQSQSDFLIAAVLEDGMGGTHVIERGYQQYVVPKEEEPWIEVPDRVVPVQQGMITGEQGATLDDLRTKGFAVHLVILASRTLHDLYDRLDTVEPPIP